MPCHPTEPFSLEGTVLAAAFSAPPVLQLIAGPNSFITFPVDYEILGVTLMSSLTNFGTAKMGVFVLFGTSTPTITYDTTTAALHGAITGQNSIVGPPAVPIPSDKSVPKVWLAPIRLPAGKRIAIYAYGDTTAGNLLTVNVALDMRQIGNNRS